MSIDPDELLAQVQAEASAESSTASEDVSPTAIEPEPTAEQELLMDVEPEPAADQAAETSGNSDSDVESWPLPDFSEKPDLSIDVPSNVLGMKPSWYGHEEVAEEPDVQIKPMTIEELEQLRESAYEEGFTEGKAEGHTEGLAAGHAEGVEQGKEQGHKEGLAQGLEDGQQDIADLSERWSSLIDRLHQPNKLIDNSVEQQLLKLAMQLATEIVQVELKTNPDVIVNTLKQAVQALPLQKQQIQISLNPEDMTIIQQVFPPETLDKKQWQLLADGSIEQGDCLVETELSSVGVEMKQVIKQSLQSFTRQNSEADGFKSETE